MHWQRQLAASNAGTFLAAIILKAGPIAAPDKIASTMQHHANMVANIDWDVLVPLEGSVSTDEPRLSS